MNQRLTLAAAFLIFIAIGMLAAIIGPALPTLADRTGTDLASIGVLVTTSYLGTLVAQIIAGPLNDRLGQRPVMLVGIVLGALGALVMALSRSLWLAALASSVYGVGFGALDVSTNLLIAQRFAHRSVPVLNLLHVFFGVGSIIGPAVAGLALDQADTAIPAFWVGIAVVLLPVPLVLRLAPGPIAPSQAENGALTADFRYRHPLLWLLGAILLLYVGVEAGLGSWITAYVARSTPAGEETGALVTSAYWAALTVGRVLGAVYGGRFVPYHVLRASLWGMLAGGIVLAFGTGSLALTVVAVLVIGLFSGPPFPTVIAIVTMTFKSAPGKATSVITALASVGASVMPWIMGVLLERVSPGVMALFVTAETILLVVFYVLTQRFEDRRAGTFAPATHSPRGV